MGFLKVEDICKIGHSLVTVVTVDDRKPDKKGKLAGLFGSAKLSLPIFAYSEEKPIMIRKMAGSSDAKYVWKNYQHLANDAKIVGDENLKRDYLASGARFYCYPELYSFSGDNQSAALDEMQNNMMAINECLKNEKSTDKGYLEIMTAVKVETVKKIAEAKLKEAEKGKLIDVERFKKDNEIIRAMAEEAGVWEKYSAGFEKAQKKVAEMARKVRQNEQLTYERDAKACLDDARKYAEKNQIAEANIEIDKANELVVLLDDKKDYLQQIEMIKKDVSARYDKKIAEIRLAGEAKEKKWRMSIENKLGRVEWAIKKIKEADTKAARLELEVAERYARISDLYSDYQSRIENYRSFLDKEDERRGLKLKEAD